MRRNDEKREVVEEAMHLIEKAESLLYKAETILLDTGYFKYSRKSDNVFSECLDVNLISVINYLQYLEDIDNAI